MNINKNNLNDILKFDFRHSSMTRWEFFGTVMERMERSQHLYTFVDDNRLLVYCWIRMHSADSLLQPSRQEPAWPSSSIVLYDLYVQEEFKNTEIAQRFVCQLLYELKKMSINEAIHYSGDLSKELQTAIKRCGFYDDSVKAIVA